MPPITLILACSLLLLLGFVRRSLSGTTLAAVWCWAVATVLVITGAELALTVSGDAIGTRGETPSSSSPLGFAAAMVVFCPGVALLGAKRPQDKPWQLIVLSLWGILMLPSFEWLLRGGGDLSEIHPARGWFLLILTLLGAVNHLPTRYWLSAILVALGQVALVHRWLPLPSFDLIDLRSVAVPIALGLWLAALLWGIVQARRAAGAAGIDRVWSDFRDAFGAVWALRVVERMNAAAVSSDWPVRLTWDGFRTAEGEPIDHWPPEIERSANQVLANLLRRFVSSDWIHRRMTARDPATALARVAVPDA